MKCVLRRSGPLDQHAREKKEFLLTTVVPTAVHGVFDYSGAIGLIASPFIFGFANVGGMAVFLPILLSAGVFLYSLLTVYELRIPGVKFITYRDAQMDVARGLAEMLTGLSRLLHSKQGNTS